MLCGRRSSKRFFFAPPLVERFEAPDGYHLHVDADTEMGLQLRSPAQSPIVSNSSACAQGFNVDGELLTVVLTVDDNEVFAVAQGESATTLPIASGQTLVPRNFTMLSLRPWK